MPLPVAPLAFAALRYGAVALAAYAAARRLAPRPLPGHYDQRAEDALEDVAEGLSTHAGPGHRQAATRMRRVIRIGEDGPGVEVDLAGFARLKWRRV